MSEINWQRILTIPRTPFTHITVKDAEGNLYNATTDRGGQIHVATTAPIVEWIPNNEI